MLMILFLLHCTHPTNVPPQPHDQTSAMIPHAERRDIAVKTIAQESVAYRLEPLEIKHPELKTRHIDSPFEQTSCWSAFGGEDELSGYPDIKYICVSNQGDVIFPFTTKNFDALLIRENQHDWTDKAYIQAAEMYIHLQQITRQHAGWVSLSQPEQFLNIQFNMSSDNIDVRKKKAANITAPQVKRMENATQVQLFTWTLIGGALEKWTIDIRPNGIQTHTEQLGRFGGGGYD